MLTGTIDGGAKTVSTIAAHFEALKQQAVDVLGSFGGSERGYFTPAEDDAVRHLLVSYWQSRNALIELVLSLRDFQKMPEESRSPAFLVAYAGALVLVDAARFLRDHFHDNAVARRKLNAPEPEFGIVEGTYERVQKSLTSPVHAWHLYHAAEYFDRHKDELQSLAAGTPLEGMVELIRRLQERIDISPARYALTRARVRGRQLVNAIKQNLWKRSLYGLQKAVSQFISGLYMKPGHQPGMPAAVCDEFKQLLEPGDVLITRKEHALTNYFLPGFWPHVALYLGDADRLQTLGLHEHANLKPRWRQLLECDAADPHRVLEAMKDGVRIRSLASPFASDALAVIRPRLEPNIVAEAIGRGMFHEGKPYDFDFDFTRSECLVCTEVVYRSFDGLGGVAFRLSPRAGRMTLAAEDLMRMSLAGEVFDPLAVYSPKHGERVLRGEDAAGVFRVTVAAG